LSDGTEYMIEKQELERVFKQLASRDMVAD
jgi:hypothetical protein